jgi:predicted DCC family thiol-disulfide oxidoreductase YuxK
MTDETRVLYNAECPVCRFEIDHYRTQARDAALPIRFDDLNSGALAAWGISADDAARRLHVLRQGRVLSGIPAFIALWQQLPRYRWLGRIVNLPGVRQVATLIYDHIAAPLLYRWHLRRQQRR